MKDIPKISDAEWQVMKVLWANSPLPASVIVDNLEPQTQWKPKTIQTLIGRLVKKRAVGFTQENRTYLYYPLIEESECIKEETQSFLERVYNGSFNLMVANFLKEQKLSREDIEELKQILDEIDD